MGWQTIEARTNRYDHLGRRVQKITPEATHTYFYDGWLLVKEAVERSGDTRRCGVSPRRDGGAGSSTSLGEDAAGSRVSIEEDVIEYHWGKDPVRQHRHSCRRSRPNLSTNKTGESKNE